MERARVTYIDETVKKDSLLVYGLKVFRLFAGRCDSVVVRVREREREKEREIGIRKVWVQTLG